MSGPALSMTRNDDASGIRRAGQPRPDDARPDEARPQVVIVTGLSGAGRTTALRALEDLGYEAVDNPPLVLLAGLLHADTLAPRPMAIGIDVRTRDFAAPTSLALLDRIADEGGPAISLLFLDCDDEVLGRRFTETRRRHPLATDRPVLDGIRREREIVWPLRQRADLVIDTSTLPPAELKRILEGHYALNATPRLALTVMSFSYRHGLPREADLVIDVRFLDNPHYDPALRPLTGRDPAVGQRVAADPGFPTFFDGLTAWLAPLLPRYAQEGKSYLTIAIGCTGGKHRSVYVAERLAAWLTAAGSPARILHRDVDRSR